MKYFISFYTVVLLTFFTSSHFLNACQHCDGLRDDCFEARNGSKGASGRWVDDITPKRGWRCIGAEDLGVDTTKECEMCEREQVRYTHHMIHGVNNPLQLDVGCICAGYMEGYFDDQLSMQESQQGAHRRVQELQNRANRRLNFPTLKWKISKNGNPYIKVRNGPRVTITKSKYNQYSAIIDSTKLNQWFNDEVTAKLAAFDHIYPNIAL